MGVFHKTIYIYIIYYIYTIYIYIIYILYIYIYIIYILYILYIYIFGQFHPNPMAKSQGGCYFSCSVGLHGPGEVALKKKNPWALQMNSSNTKSGFQRGI